MDHLTPLDNMNKEKLWKLIRDNFEEDDGSLPTFELNDLDRSTISKLYKNFVSGATVISKDPTFWDTKKKCNRNLNDVENAASLVVLGVAEPFYFCIKNFPLGEVKIPYMGIFIFQQTIAIDYQMGSYWTPEKVLALFFWCKAIIDSVEGSSLQPSESEGPPDPKAFMKAWEEFNSFGNTIDNTPP